MLIKKQAFTLSEVLIALTIIGVVAAITVPMLMTDTNARANRVKVQKAYATLSNALKIGQAKYDFDMSDITSVRGVGITEAASAVYTIENMMTKTLDVIRTSATSYPFAGGVISQGTSGSLQQASYATTGISSNATVFKSRDGIYYIFPQLSKSGSDYVPCTETKPCVGYIDINGKKGPNELITCTSGTDGLWSRNSTPSECTVSKNAITDIYPFVMYGATVVPANSAFETVLAGNE